MKAAELAAMARFFEQLVDGQRYLSAANAAAAGPDGRCDCQINLRGKWALAGRCEDPATRPAHCRTEAHLAVRIHLDQLKLPTAHLSDPQLADVMDHLEQLVRQAPDLTQRRFVIALQEQLGASLAPLAQQDPR